MRREAPEHDALTQHCQQSGAEAPAQAGQQSGGYQAASHPPRSSAAQLAAIQELEVGMHLLDDPYLSSPDLHRPPEPSAHSNMQGTSLETMHMHCTKDLL